MSKKRSGFSLVELLAAIVIVMLILAPLLMLSYNLIDNMLKDGDRNQVINVARGILDDARDKVRDGANAYDYEYSAALTDYNVVVTITNYKSYTGLKDILVTVSKKQSRLGEVNIRTVVWQHANE